MHLAPRGALCGVPACGSCGAGVRGGGSRRGRVSGSGIGDGNNRAWGGGRGEGRKSMKSRNIIG